MKKSESPSIAVNFKRSPCAVANTLEIIGDKWTLLIIRDLFMGKTTYKEFQDSPESIPTNILAARLKSLEAHGLLEKNPYQDRPVRNAYTLTHKGKALGPILMCMKNWGEEFIPGTQSMQPPTAPRKK